METLSTKTPVIEASFSKLAKFSGTIGKAPVIRALNTKAPVLNAPNCNFSVAKYTDTVVRAPLN